MRMLRTLVRRGAVIIAGLVLAVMPAAAQTSTANLRGYVRSVTTGEPSADVQVSARNVADNATRGVITNAAGFYYMGGLRPGRYEVTVRRIGVQPQTREVVLAIGTTTDENFTTQEATVQLGAVAVTAEALGTTAKTSEVGTNISREQIENLPNAERNFLDIARLAPGVTAKAVNDGDKFLSAGGQPAEAVNVFVDGATYKNDVLRGGVVGQDASRGNPFPQGAVQEFRIITQNYKAEYQKAASAIITATTRSGGNAWQTELFTQAIGKAYVARDAFTAAAGGPRPNYQRLQLGANVGGPLVKDKLFFFGTYELNARNEPAYVRYNNPTAAAAAPANVIALLEPKLGEFTSEFRQHLGFGKLTWNKSDRSTFDLSTTIRSETDFRGFGGGNAFDAAENVRIHVYNGVGNWRYAANSWLNEAQVNYQTFVWSPEARNGNQVGSNYDQLLRIGGKDSWQTFTQDRLSLRDDITRSGVALFGDHVIKGGGSVDFLTYNAEKTIYGNPLYTYRAETNWSRPSSVNFGYGDPSLGTNNQQFGVYAQDDWSVNHKLVLNLGIRWDAETNGINNTYATPKAQADSLRAIYTNNQNAFNVAQPTDTTAGGGCCVFVQRRPIDELGGLGNYLTSGKSDRPIYMGAFQPRVGASYDLFANGHTVFFGGMGVYYDRNYWNTLFDEQYRRQYRQTGVSFNPPGGTCNNCINWEDRFYDPAQLLTIAGRPADPEVFLVKNDMRPPRTTQSSVGIRQMVRGLNLTLSYNGIRGTHGMNFIRGSQWGGPGPNFNTVFIADDEVKTWYDALQVQVERPMRADRRWGGSIAYTLAKTEQQGKSNDIFWGFDDRYTTVGDMPRERAPGDQRHGVVANGTFRMPWDFRLSGIVSLGSGIAVNATDNSVGEGIYRGSYVFTPPSRPFLGIGNVFAYQNLDLRAEKAFVVAGTQRVSIVGDLFNAFNSANYGCYRADIPPGGVSADPAYGTPGCAGLGRRFQIGLRYGYQGSASTLSREQNGTN